VVAAGCSSSDAPKETTVPNSTNAASVNETPNTTEPVKEATVKETPRTAEAPKEATVEETPKEEATVEETPKEEATEEEKPSTDEAPKEIVSTSFSDFTPYLDSSSTSLQKESFFDDHFKGKYVKWSGTVSSVTESMGSYNVGVKHSDKSLFSDVTVTMRDDQKEKLLQLKEGSKITYTAKLTRYGDILGIYADDGTIES
jgi:hypothetical protein